MTDELETFILHPTNERPKRFKGSKEGTVLAEDDFGHGKFNIFRRSNGEYLIEKVWKSRVSEEEIIEVFEAEDEEDVYNIVGWSSAAKAFYETQGFNYVEDLDDDVEYADN